MDIYLIHDVSGQQQDTEPLVEGKGVPCLCAYLDETKTG